MKRENKNNRTDGVCYRTKAPKIRIKEDWQIKLEVIANTNRDDFTDSKEYNKYIEEHTKIAIENYAKRLKDAWAEVNSKPANTTN